MELKATIKSIREYWMSPIVEKSTATPPAPESRADHSAYRGNWTPIRRGTFNGEKTPGELGSIYKLTPNHNHLRLRALEAKLTNDTVGIITNKFFKWVIGSGLKAQSEPNEKALKTEKVPKVKESFRDDVESRFDVFINSTKCDYKGMKNLHALAVDAFDMAFFGDVLIVLRYENGHPNVQLVDGEHVQTPYLDNRKWDKEAKERGNIIRNGIEIDKRGSHVAYYISTIGKDEFSTEFERIPARGKTTGRTMAWLYGLKKHRPDNDRFIPQISQVLEKLAKIDRYTEATVGTAEERAKIVYAIEHSKDSTGENPLLGMTRQASGMARSAAAETEGYELGEKTAATVAATTGKETFNMPIGAKMSALYSQNEIQYETFWKAIFKSLCASVDIPPEVALQEYNSNYSASRAAIKAWEYVVNIFRKKFSENFYTPFYQLWLHTEILKGNISAPGYLANSTNFMVMEAYGRVRFEGENMPHIDPVKEVKATVEMLKNNLTTHEKATAALNQGDWNENYSKLEKEKARLPKEEPDEVVPGKRTLKAVGDGTD